MSERVDKAIFNKYPATHPVTLEYMLMKQCITELEAEIKYEQQLNTAADNRLLNETKAHNKTYIRLLKLEAQIKAANECESHPASDVPMYSTGDEQWTRTSDIDDALATLEKNDGN